MHTVLVEDVLKVKCFNDIDNGTWKFSKDKVYYFNQSTGSVMGDNFNPMYCYTEDSVLVAAIKEPCIFEIIED